MDTATLAETELADALCAYCGSSATRYVTGEFICSRFRCADAARWDHEDFSISLSVTR